MIDGDYERKLGTLVLDAADTVVWLDQPTRVWLPAPDPPLQPQSAVREELWNGNHETWRDLFWGRESLIGYALMQQPRRRREWPARLANHPVVRLRTPDEVRRWTAS